MVGPGCLPLILFLILLVLLPLLFIQILAAALLKLKLDPDTALLLMVAIIFGSAINIPVRRVIRDEVVHVHPFAIFGLMGLWPNLVRMKRETMIAVNLGGCLIPAEG
jgi:uncharacterized membrane protein